MQVPEPAPAPPTSSPLLSVVVPVRNEVANIAPLIAEIRRALDGTAHEIVYVDDGSTDGTASALAAELKVFRRADFLELPAFDHMHRFLPALFIRAGGAVVSVPVGHRPRVRGTSKYGTLDRLWVGVFDLVGVAWLQRRGTRPEVE